MSKINEDKKNYGYHVSWHAAKADCLMYVGVKKTTIGSLTLEIQNGACQEIITNTLNALRYLC